jgi:hypothetical protein
VGAKWEPGNETKLREDVKEGMMPPGAEEIEVPFTLPDGLWRTNFDLTWQPANASDMDLEIYWKDTTTGDWRKVGSSGNPAGSGESTSLIQPRGGEYKAKILNFLGGDGQPYKLVITHLDGNIKITQGTTEAYTLTCETPQGDVIATRDVTIGRSQSANVNPCDAATSGVPVNAVLGARSGKFLTLSRKTVRMSKSGVVPVRASCAAAAKAPCSGVLQLHSGKRKLGQAKFSIRAGRTGIVKVKLGKASRKFVKRRKSVIVTASATGDIGTAVASKFKLRAARR